MTSQDTIKQAQSDFLLGPSYL